MTRWTISWCALWLVVPGRADCGLRIANCGLAERDFQAHNPQSAIHNPQLTIGRLHYDGGGDWYGNPSSLPNLLTAIRQRTALPVTDRERVVTLTSAELWDTPFIYMTGHGNVHFSDEEVRILRRYLENGGFLHADDN